MKENVTGPNIETEKCEHLTFSIKRYLLNSKFIQINNVDYYYVPEKLVKSIFEVKQNINKWKTNLKPESK